MKAFSEEIFVKKKNGVRQSSNRVDRTKREVSCNTVYGNWDDEEFK